VVTNQQGILALLSWDFPHCTALGSEYHRVTYSKEIPPCCSNMCYCRQVHRCMKMLTKHPQEVSVGSTVVQEDIDEVCIGGERILVT